MYTSDGKIQSVRALKRKLLLSEIKKAQHLICLEFVLEQIWRELFNKRCLNLYTRTKMFVPLVEGPLPLPPDGVHDPLPPILILYALLLLTVIAPLVVAKGGDVVVGQGLGKAAFVTAALGVLCMRRY